MADLTDVYDALRQAHAAGDTANAQKLADYVASQTPASPDFSKLSTADLQAIQRGDLSGVSTEGLRVIAGRRGGQSFDSDGKGNLVPTGSPEAREMQSPTRGMSNLDTFTAAAGKAPVDLARGIGQMLHLVTRGGVADSRQLDAPLMSSGAGKWGNFAGNVATMAPSMLVPGANTLAGASSIGALSGLLGPSTSTAETIKNTALGGATGPAGLLLGRGATAVAKGVKAAFIDPFTKSGQSTIAARALQSFAGSPQDAAAAAGRLANPGQVLPGVQPTTAELANNGGLAQLERTVRNNPEYLQAFVGRDQGNRNAMVGALQGIAGTPADRAAAESLRMTATAPLYEAAGAATVPSNEALQALLQRPSMQGAMSRAAKLAEERGDGPLAVTPGLGTPSYNGKAIQYLKMGLSDIADTGPQKGMGAHELGAVKTTAGNLDGWIQQNHPALAAADAKYAALSRPINRMDIGSEIANRTLPALSDFGNNTRLNGNSFANAVSRDGDGIASRVTGDPNAKLAGILEPHELAALQQIGAQFARKSNAQELGKAIGSNTGQNLVSQNVLAQFLGPLGLPQNAISRFASGAVGRSLGYLPTKMLYGAVEPDVMRHLANAALDPKIAAGLLNSQIKPAAARRLLSPGLGFLTPASLATGRRLADSPQQ